MSTTSRKLYGFDYLRAICSLVVVLLHIQHEFSTHLHFTQIEENLINSFIYNLGFLAVPVFLQISLFLFYFNSNHKENYFQKRMIDITKIYALWFLIYPIFSKLIIEHEELPSLNFLSITTFIASGGHTLMYFLSDLILLTAISGLLMKTGLLKNKYLVVSFLLISSLIVFLLPFIRMFTLDLLNIDMTQHWNPLNFIPYIFSSYLLYMQLDSETNSLNKMSVAWWCIILLVLCCTVVIEWRYLQGYDFWEHGLLLPIYSRLSLIIAAYIVSYLAINYLSYPPPVFIQLISNCSLGIYCIHHILIDIAVWVYPQKLEFFPFPDSIIFLMIFALIAIITISLTNFAKKIKFLEEYL